MEATVILVAILSIYWIKTRSVEDAAVDVFLPIFLLVPTYYAFQVPHLPPLTFPTAALMPIIVTLLVFRWREWKFQRTDLWVALFFGGSFLTELINSGFANAGIILAGGIGSGVLPYVLGKMLLEKDGMRERFIRRFLSICLFVAIVSVWEFRMGAGVFRRLAIRIFGYDYPDPNQIRSGHVRIEGSFGGCIQAGTIFAAAVIFSIWLGFLQKTRGDERKYLGIRRSTLVSIGLVGGLLMADSRGPMLGAILAFLVARIGMAKNMRRAIIVTALLLAIGGTIGYVKAEKYTSADPWAEGVDIDQQNAIYRRVLLDQYKPYVQTGGLLGWGVVNRPVVPGMFSIDNAYLNIQLIQGNLGMWTIILMGGEALLAAFLAARRATQRTDICFAFCIGGAMAGLLFSETTVWLGPPMFQLFFLLLGWSHSLRQTHSVGVVVPQAVPARFAFRRVIA